MKIGVCLPNEMKGIQLTQRFVQVISGVVVRSFLHFVLDMLQTRTTNGAVLVFRMTYTSSLQLISTPIRFSSSC